MYLLTGLMGILLIFSPFLLSYDFHLAAAFISIMLGMNLVIISSFEGLDDNKSRWEYFLGAISGMGLILSPFVFGYANIGAALWSSLAVGVLVLIGSVLKILPRFY